jgi:phage replication O-like protein O
MSAAERFVRFPTMFLEALLQAPLSGTQWRILGWTVRRTWGWNRESTSFSWYRLARDLSLDRAGVARAGRRLLSSGILSEERGKLRAQPDPTHWRPLRKAVHGSAATGVNADENHAKPTTGVAIGGDGDPRNGCQESSLFRRAKDSIQDKSKTSKESHPCKSDADRDRFRTSNNTQRPHLAGAAVPIPGKYDRLSQN